MQHSHFSTVSLDGSVPDDVVLKMIDHSYEVVVGKFQKYIQNEIEEMCQQTE